MTEDGPLKKDDLLKILSKCNDGFDTSELHIQADKALIKFINDPEITEAYNKIYKWYD